MSNKTTYSNFEDFILQPLVQAAAVDLAAAASSSLGVFAIPAAFGSVMIKKIGMSMAAAGGAQTVAGSAKLQIAGADVVDQTSTAFTMASVASHAAFAVVETDLNSVTTTSTPYSTINHTPIYPTATTGQKIELLVAAQGTGAGDRTMFPYLVVCRLPQ